MEIAEFFVNSVFAILFLPLWLILIIMSNAAIPFVSSKKLTFNLTLFGNLINLMFAICGLVYCFSGGTQVAVEKHFMCLNSGGLQVACGMLVDSVSSLLFLFSTIIVIALQVYSYSGFKTDKEFHRLFILLNLLNFSLVGLIFASNAVQTYIFWEFLGVIAYFLLNFWYTRKSSNDAALKAFIFNKIGDIALLGGIVVLLYFAIIFPGAQNVVLLGYDNISFTAETLYSMFSEPVYTLLVLLPIFAILARMAQLPLSVWLADSGESPVIVSALIQGLLPVVTGGILLIRFYPLFILSDMVMKTFVFIGILGALVFAFVAMSQNNIKKLLAYSTSSQLGFVLVGFGVGAYSGAVHYLLAHGLAKVLLILSAGIVIKSMKNENDIKYFGGLRQYMPLCAFAFLIGCFSLSGLSFAGFFLEKAILAQIFDYGNSILVVGALAFIFLTVFYLFRAYFLIFEGQNRFGFEVQKNPCECSFVVGFLMILCAGSIFWGPKVSNIIYFIKPESLASAGVVQLTILLFIVLATIYIAFGLYVNRYNGFVLIKEKLLCKQNLLYKLSYNNFYMDEVYSFLVEHLFLRFCRLIDFVDKYIINAIVILVSLGTRVLSYLRSKMQNGNVQSYVLYAFWGVGLIMLVVAAIYILASLVEV